ncbi:MAG: hypothetical protein WBV74_06900 [Pseudonocardiaceae bacterium]
MSLTKGSAITAMIHRLEKAGYLHRRRDGPLPAGGEAVSRAVRRIAVGDSAPARGDPGYAIRIAGLRRAD